MKTLGDRMKENYENRSKTYLTRRTPVIIRLDGKAFHTFTRKFKSPFSEKLSDAMIDTAKALCEEIAGARLAYIQSDEISLLLHDYNKFDTAAWFDYSVQKVVSVTASIATAHFNRLINVPHLAYFDSRAFNIPEEEVNNYFIWRQKDWERNSVAMLAQSLFSPKELHEKNRQTMLAMCSSRGEDWEKLEDRWKLGTILRYDADQGWCRLHQSFIEAPFIMLDALEREER
jgi:tRNA(His) guanylyltransferase